MKTLKVLLLFLLFLGVANNAQAQNQIFVLSRELVFSNPINIFDIKLGGDSIFIATADKSGGKIMILD